MTKPVPSSYSGVVAAVVGRESELAALDALLSSAESGHGGLAILVGEPGIGKSSLADAASRLAERRGFRVGWGRAWESGGAPPYFPWTEALRAVGVGWPSAATAVESAAAQFQLFRAVTDALRAASVAAGVVGLLLVIDDLHVADVSSLRMLQFVARQLRGMKLVVIGTRRDADAAMTPEVESTLARIAREGTTLALPRLARHDVTRLVEATRLPPDLEPEIWRASQGNPLFVGEMVRLLEADATLARGPLPVLQGARDILQQRIATLPEGARSVLEAAAVIGVESSLATLSAVCGVSDLSAIVAAGARSGILGSAREGRVRFGHALIRDALCGEIPPSRRAELHAKVAVALEASAAPPVIEIAHHAIDAGPHRELVERTARAVSALSAALADEDAAVLLERAISVVRADDAGSAELALMLGRTRLALGDAQGGRASCARAADIARSLGDGALFARAALAHAAEVTQGETEKATHRLLAEALDRVPQENTGLRVRLRARLAASLQPAPNPGEVARMALDAVNEARMLGDEATLLDVLHDAGAAFGEAFFVPEVVDMARDAVRLALRLGERAKLFRARIRLVFALMEIGDIAGADANIDAFESEVRATGQPRHMWPAPLLRSMRALQEGRYADVDALIEETEHLGSAFPLARATVLLHHFARLRARAAGPELLAFEPTILAMIARWNEPESYAAMMIATIRSLAGDLDTARMQFRRVPSDSTPWRVRIAAASVASTMIRIGDASRAAEMYERLLPERGRWHMFMFGGFAAEGTYSRYLGGLAALLGRWDDAERHYTEALAQAEAASARPECARVMAARRALSVLRGDVAEPIRRSSAPPKPASPSGLVLVQDGETWVLGLGEQSLRLKESRGVGYLARLVAEPDRELHALDLVGSSEGADAGDAGEALDPEARAAYKRRLAELDEELREAESWSDGARVSRARSEIEVLSAELSRAVGIGGKGRRVGSAAERARVAVTRRIREVVKRVAELSPELGRHLEATVKTGMFCSYRPL